MIGTGLAFWSRIWNPRAEPTFPDIYAPLVVLVGMDLLGGGVDGDTRDRVFGQMLRHPQHTFLVVTTHVVELRRELESWSLASFIHRSDGQVPAWENVWFLVRCSTQADVNERVPELLEIAHGNRGVVLEPLWEEVDLTPYLRDLRQVVAGCGDDGGAKCAWFRSIQEQCREAGVPCYVRRVSGEDGEPRVIDFPPEPGELAWIPSTRRKEPVDD